MRNTQLKSIILLALVALLVITAVNACAEEVNDHNEEARIENKTMTPTPQIRTATIAFTGDILSHSPVFEAA